ncbi:MULTISPECIES: AAA family ATPase [Gemella]|uniref:AAA family ATPase n=1 Tax=Gemella TaxID=1378 RepID=UPI0007683CD6|nr:MULTISPECIES: AAA family ATPase [Gemella]AME09836.1 transcriptional regulator [Gemella sp. oral taxon 928]
MKHKLLKIKKLAVVFGTFAPMHTGHVDFITKAKRENDGVLIIVSGTNTEEDRGTRDGLHLNRRFRYVREVFHDDELVVDKLDEEGMLAYPNGWEPWLKTLHKLIKDNTDYQFEKMTFYIGEEDYQKPLLSYFKKVFANEYRVDRDQINDFDEIREKEVAITIIDRTLVPVSGTEIRKNPLVYWRYITKPFRRHFTKKVLVVGSASGGKTTLIKDLGRVFNAPISLEYARHYQEVYNVRDDELDTNDYIRLFANQNEQTSNVIDSGSHSGIVFVDTNATVTMAYVDYYLKGVISEEEYQALKLSYKVAISKEKWDLIVLIPPKSAYVNDGFRDMTMASQDIRDGFTNHLIELLEQDGFKDKLLILDSDIDTFFIDNYKKTVKAIKDRLNIEI